MKEGRKEGRKRREEKRREGAHFAFSQSLLFSLSNFPIPEPKKKKKKKKDKRNRKICPGRDQSGLQNRVVPFA